MSARTGRMRRGKLPRCPDCAVILPPTATSCPDCGRARDTVEIEGLDLDSSGPAEGRESLGAVLGGLALAVLFVVAPGIAVVKFLWPYNKWVFWPVYLVLFVLVMWLEHGRRTSGGDSSSRLGCVYVPIRFVYQCFSTTFSYLGRKKTAPEVVEEQGERNPLQGYLEQQGIGWVTEDRTRGTAVARVSRAAKVARLGLEGSKLGDKLTLEFRPDHRSVRIVNPRTEGSVVLELPEMGSG